MCPGFQLLSLCLRLGEVIRGLSQARIDLAQRRHSAQSQLNGLLNSLFPWFALGHLGNALVDSVDCLGGLAQLASQLCQFFNQGVDQLRIDGCAQRASPAPRLAERFGTTFQRVPATRPPGEVPATVSRSYHQSQVGTRVVRETSFASKFFKFCWMSSVVIFDS